MAAAVFIQEENYGIELRDGFKLGNGGGWPHKSILDLRERLDSRSHNLTPAPMIRANVMCEADLGSKCLVKPELPGTFT